MINDEPQLIQPMSDRRMPPDTPPCASHEQRIALLERAVSSIERSNEANGAKLDMILTQVTRVAILEEKHTAQQADVNRAHNGLANIGKKLDELATESRAFMNYSRGQGKIIWALAGGVAMLSIKVLFFASSHGMTP